MKSLPNPALATWIDVLERQRETDKPWLVQPLSPLVDRTHRALSYRDLHCAVARIATGLLDRCVVRGTPIIIVAENRIECALLMLGALTAGAAIVPVAPPGPWRSRAPWTSFVEQICFETGSTSVLSIDGNVPDLPLRGMCSYD